MLNKKNVRKIFKHLGMQVRTLEQANACAQKNFLRNGECWDPQDKKEWHALAQNKKTLLLHDLASIGMINGIEPQQKAYTYALLMGSLKEDMMLRFNYLAELKRRGITFQEIVLLGSKRPLQHFERAGLPDSITTEAQMIQFLCEHHSFLRHESIIIVDAPMIKKDDGTFMRPTTDHTLVHFAQTAPANGACLVISNNPYIMRQTKVAQRILEQDRFPTAGAGNAIQENNCDIILLLDEFARMIYEEYKKINTENLSSP